MARIIGSSAQSGVVPPAFRKPVSVNALGMQPVIVRTARHGACNRSISLSSPFVDSFPGQAGLDADDVRRSNVTGYWQVCG